MEKARGKSSVKDKRKEVSSKEKQQDKRIPKGTSKNLAENEGRKVNLVKEREIQRQNASREKNRVRKSSQEAEISKRLKEKRTHRN